MDKKFFLNNKKLMEEFLKIDKKNFSVDELKSKLNEFLSVFSFKVANCGADLFRVRRILPGEEHNKIHDIWCPPRELITRIGRANNIGERIFYAAFDIETAICEARVSFDEYFSLAIYHISENIDGNQSSIIIGKTSDNHNFNNENYYGLWKCGEDLNRFIVREFTKEVYDGDEEQYKVSCSIASLLLSNGNKDSIIYPSVRSDNKINIAIKEEAARERLSLLNVLTCKLMSNNMPMVYKVRYPSDDLLLDCNTTIKLPRPLKYKSPMLFSEVFSDDKIETAEEMIRKIKVKN